MISLSHQSPLSATPQPPSSQIIIQSSIHILKYFYLIRNVISDNDFGFWIALKDELQLKREGLPTRFKFPKYLKDYFDVYVVKDYNTTYLGTINKFFK